MVAWRDAFGEHWAEFFTCYPNSDCANDFCDLVKPRILDKEDIERYPLYVSDSTVDFLRDVMKEVVNRGTARRFKKFTDFSVWAKTGTAQTVSLEKQKKGSKDFLEHAWVASFFSYKNHKPLAMVVLVENAGSSRPALQIAENFFKIYKEVLDG